MSLYNLQKLLYVLNRDTAAQERFRENRAELLDRYELTAEECRALEEENIGLLYVLGVNGQILMHYAAFLGIEWFDYLAMMRRGIEKYGPVRAGIYAMTGTGQGFVEEENDR